jgi:hypothetical protein
VRRDESVPGLSETTGSVLPPTTTGAYNDRIDWSASWNAWDGPPLDEPNAWQVSIRSTDTVPGTTRVTPRRLQAFEVAPDFAYRWSRKDIVSGLELASGTFAADADGLLTTPPVTLDDSGTRVRLEKSFTSSTSSISLSSGGSQVLDLACGADLAGKLYLVLGSISGTTPTLAMDGIGVPLTADAYFDLTLAAPNSGLLSPSLSSLQGDGRATCVLSLPPGINPNLAGMVVHHAFLVLDLPGTGVGLFVSNPVSVTLSP